MADDLRQKSYKVTFARHGGMDSLTFDCRTDAALFAWWVDYAGAGLDAAITEEEG